MLSDLLRSSQSLLATGCSFLLIVGSAIAQPPPAQTPAAPAQPRKPKEKVLDPDLLLHIGVTAGKLRAGGFVDETEKIRGRVVGNPMRTTLGPSEGFAFNGKTDWLVLAGDIGTQRVGLPTRDLTVQTWVSTPAPVESGTIVGCTSGETGWEIGYAPEGFRFALAGANPTGSKITTIKAEPRVEPGRWYFVAATYDGRTMRLFVNGDQRAESKEQGGEVVYETPAPYLIAASGAAGAERPSRLTMLETKILSRAFTPQQITEEYVPGVRLTSYQPQLEATQRFVVKSYIQFVTMDSAIICWETSRPGRGTVEYGEQLPYAMKASEDADATIHKVRLTGLKAQTPYFYRVRTVESDGSLGSEVIGDDLTFQTAVRPETPFAFAVIGDTQKNKPVIEKLQAFAFTLRPNFEIHLGDVVDKGPDKSEWTEELLAGSWPLMGRVCMYPCIGNHEENHSNYYQYFALPDPQCWYTYTYGNAQFFSLDTNKAVDPESEQYRWLDRELGKSTATWKFVYHHHPVYSSDENDYGDTYKEKSTYGEPRHRALAALLEKHCVDIDFSGHIHSYERTWPIYQGAIDQSRGVRYIVAGGGGGGLESAGPSRSWFAQRVYRGHHICQLMIHDKTLQLQAFDLEGRLFDSMEIHKP